MLVIGPDCCLRTIYNLARVDAGFDRVAARDVLDDAAARRRRPAARRVYQRLLGTLRHGRACRSPPRCRICRWIGWSRATTPRARTTAPTIAP